MERIQISRAMTDLPQLLDRIRSQGATFELVSGNEVVARLGPGMAPKTAGLGDFDRLFENLPSLGTDSAKSPSRNR